MLGDFYGEYYATINGVQYQSTQASWNELDRYGQVFICKEDTAIWYSADQSARDWEFNNGKLSAGGQYYFYGKLDQYAYDWAKSLYLVGMRNREQLPGSGPTLGWTTADCFPNDCTLTLDPGKGAFEGMEVGEKKALTRPYYYTYHIGNEAETDSRLPILAGHAVRNWVNTERSISFDPEFAYTQTGDLTLNAIWEPSIVTVTFDYQKNGQTVKTVTKSLTVGSDIKLQQYAKEYKENKVFTINYFANKIYLNNDETATDTDKPAISTSNYWWSKLPEPQPWSMPYTIAYKIKDFVYNGITYKIDSFIEVPNTDITITCRYEDTGTLDLSSIYVKDSNILATSQDVSVTGILKVTKIPPFLNSEIIRTDGLTSIKKFSSKGWYKDWNVKLTVDEIKALILAGVDSVDAYAKFIFDKFEVTVNKPAAIKEINATYTLGQANFYTPKTVNYTDDNIEAGDPGLAWVIKQSEPISANIEAGLDKLIITKFETSIAQPLTIFKDYVLKWNSDGLLVGKKDDTVYSFTDIVQALNLEENVTNIELDQEYNQLEGTCVNSIDIPNLGSELLKNSGITFSGIIPANTNTAISEPASKSIVFNNWRENLNYNAYGVFKFAESKVITSNKILKAELKAALQGIYDRIWYLYSKQKIDGNPIINQGASEVCDSLPEIFYLNENVMLPYGALCRKYLQFNLLTNATQPGDWGNSGTQYYRKEGDSYRHLPEEGESWPTYAPNTYYTKLSAGPIIENLRPNFTEGTSSLIELDTYRRAAQFFIKYGFDQTKANITFNEVESSTNLAEVLYFKKGKKIIPLCINNFYERLNSLMGYTTTKIE